MPCIVAVMALSVRSPAHRLSAGRGPGLHHQPDHPARRHHPAADPGQWRKQVAELLSQAAKRRMSISSSPSPASFLRRRRPECRHRLHPARGLERAPGRPEQRRTRSRSAPSCTSSAFPTPRSFRIVPPSVPELGNATGFDLQMEDRGNLGHDAPDPGPQPAAGPGGAGSVCWRRCAPTAWTIRRSCMSISTRPRPTRWACRCRHQLHPVSAAWGGSFVNDFIDRDRVKRVYMQGDAPYRMTPEDLDRWYVRSATGTMAPFSSFATARWTIGPATLDPL